MKIVNMACPNCGAKLTEDEGKKTYSCECCGSSFAMEQEQVSQGMNPDNAMVAGYEFEKGRQVAQYEAERDQIAAAQAEAEARRRQQEAIRAQRAAAAAAAPRKSKAWIWIIVVAVAIPIFATLFILTAISRSGYDFSQYNSNTIVESSTEETDPTYDVICTVDKANVVTFEADLQENGATETFEYTAPRNGRYELVLKSNETHGPTVTITDDLGNEILHTWFVGQKTVDLIGENNYHIQCYSGSIPMVITLMIIEQKETVEISGLGAVSDSFEYEHQANYYTFTPDEDGTYSIRIANDGDSITCDTYIYDEYDNEIKDFRSGKTFDTWHDVDLSAGTTYTIVNCQFIGLGNYDFVIIKK